MMNEQLLDKLNINILTISSQNDRLIIEHINQAACELLGFSANEAQKTSISTLLNDNSTHAFGLNNFTSLLTDPQQSPFEFELNSKQRPIPVICSVTVDRSESRFIVMFQAAACLKQHQQHLDLMQKAIDQTASAILITDPHGIIEYVNPKFVELTGYSEAELIGNSPSMLQSGNTEPEQYQALWELLLNTGKWQGEIKNQHKNGEHYWAHETISTITNEQGEVTHILAIEEDITQRKQAKSALQESEQRFRQMAAMTGEWLWEQDPDGYYIYCSIAVQSILGFEPEEIIGKHYTDLLTPQDKVKKQTTSLNQEPFYSITNLYYHQNGSNIITESTGLPIKDKFGKLIKWRGVDHNITVRTHYHNALKESELRKRLIIESALNAIILMDSYGIITDWNTQAEKMFGWSYREAVNKRLDKLIIPPRYRQAHRDGLEKFLLTGQGPMLNHILEHTAVHRNGKEFPVEISISPLKLGNAYVFSGFIHDISTRKAAEKSLREAQINIAITQKELEIAQRIQSSLLPTEAISHESFEITGICISAMGVGGDYFDYFYQSSNLLDILIADVSGHSIGPALFMVETRSVLKTQANWQGTPAETVGALNNVLYQDLYNADYFITLFYFQYNIQTERLSYANAGHPSPLLYKQSSDTCTPLDADGMIIGVKKDIIFEQKSTPFTQGDILLLYTDGLIEAQNDKGEFFGIERVCKSFMNNSKLNPDNIITILINELKQFCARDSFEDDISLVVFKRK